MKKNLSKSLALVAVLALAALSMTSCNRGYGCPSDFSVAENVVQPIATTVINQIK